VKGTTVILQISREISLPFSWNFLGGGGALNRLTRAIRPFRVKALRFGKMLSARSRQTQKTPIAQPAFHH